METESRKQNLDKSAMHLFGESGMTILPWTKQMLCVLWEQLRFLVHLICYSFMSVFQMFRLEVHLRISEETGPRIQHMTTPGNPGEGFFLSSLFDNNKSVIVSSSSPLSKLSSDLTGNHPLLSSLVSDELCCSLVDDFVARAAEGFSDTEELNIGQHASWKLGCPGEWNVFVGSEHSSGSNSSCCSKDFYSRSLQEDKVFSWENDESGKSDGASPPCDPYSPLTFSASIFSYSPKESTEPIEKSSWEFRVKSSASFEDGHAHFCPAFGGRSDSESSWWSSDSSADGDREESEKLWDLFTSSSDPYHPLHFSACASNTKPSKKDTNAAVRPDNVIEPPTELPPSPTGTESIGPSCLSEDEEEALWQSLCHSDDPYHPLHFKACIRSPSSDASTKSSASTAVSQYPANACSDSTLDSALEFSPSAFQTLTKSKKPQLLRKKRPKDHCCSSSPDKPVLVPWRRELKSRAIEEHEDGQPAVKKVQFSPQVQVHKMRAWSFAHQASRKGHWEELARDRDRFRRRIQETEQAIGYCLSQAHREKVLAREKKHGTQGRK